MRVFRTALLGSCLAGTLLMAAAPAWADRDGWRHWDHRGWHGGWWHHGWVAPPVYYAPPPPPAYYVPPPAYYPPPPPVYYGPPGITFSFGG